MFHVSCFMFHANMPLNQQIRTMQGDIKELQKGGLAAPPKPQRAEPPQGLPVEEKPAPPRPVLRTEIQLPAKPIPSPPPMAPRPVPAPVAPPRPAFPRMEVQPPAPPKLERGEPAPPKPVQPAPIPPKPTREELSAKERLFITPKPATPIPPAPPKMERGEPAPPKKIEPSFKPIIPPERTRWPKLLFTTALVAALAGGIGGFFYWWFIVKQPPLPPPPPPLEKPVSLIPVDETKDYIITLTETDELTKKERISTNIHTTITECNESPGTFRRILIKNITQEKEEYLNLYPLLNTMGIPNGLGVGIPDSANYTLFFYADLPYGGCRMGLVAEINDIEEAKKQITDWKPYIENEIESAMKDLLNTANAILTPATPDFQNNLYKNMIIRYKNYPEPSLSFDYAIYEPGNLLIFTTSRESMWAVIDKLE